MINDNSIYKENYIYMILINHYKDCTLSITFPTCLNSNQESKFSHRHFQKVETEQLEAVSESLDGVRAFID